MASPSSRGRIDFGRVDLGCIYFGCIYFGRVYVGRVDFGSVDFGRVDFGCVDFGRVLEAHREPRTATPTTSAVARHLLFMPCEHAAPRLASRSGCTPLRPVHITDSMLADQRTSADDYCSSPMIPSQTVTHCLRLVSRERIFSG